MTPVKKTVVHSKQQSHKKQHWLWLVAQNAVTASLAVFYGSTFIEALLIYIFEFLAIAFFIHQFNRQKSKGAPASIQKQVRSESYGMLFIGTSMIGLVMFFGSMSNLDCGLICESTSKFMESPLLFFMMIGLVFLTEHQYAKRTYRPDIPTKIHNSHYQRHPGTGFYGYALSMRLAAHMLSLFGVMTYYYDSYAGRDTQEFDYIVLIAFLFIMNTIIDLFVYFFFDPRKYEGL